MNIRTDYEFRRAWADYSVRREATRPKSLREAVQARIDWMKQEIREMGYVESTTNYTNGQKCTYEAEVGHLEWLLREHPADGS